jgi:hypothetical protein
LILLASHRKCLGPRRVPAANTGQGFGIVGAEPFQRVPPPMRRSGWMASFACLPWPRLNARVPDRAKAFRLPCRARTGLYRRQEGVKNVSKEAARGNTA